MTEHHGCQTPFVTFCQSTEKRGCIQNQKEMYINLNVMIRLNQLKSWEIFGMLSPLMSMLV